MKDYTDILNALDSMTHLPSGHISFKERFLSKYGLKIKEDIEHILTKTEDKSTLENEFARYIQQWEFPSIYTAFHQSGVVPWVFALVELVCDRHNASISKDEKPWVPAEILFRNLDLISNNEDYPDLCAFKKPDFDVDEWQKLNDDIIKSGLPTTISALQMTAEEDDQRCQYTQWNNMLRKYEREKNKEQAEIYQQKINHLKTAENFALIFEKPEQEKRIERINELEEPRQKYIAIQQKLSRGEVKAYGDYIVPYNLSNLLKTHVLSARGSLIPISVLIKDASHRPYENTAKEGYTPLSPEEKEDEIQRLYQHSSEAFALYENQAYLKTLLNNQTTLLEQLITLCKHLRFYDASEGNGTEETAGEGVYEHIRRFEAFYKTLGYQLEKYPKNYPLEGKPLEEGVVYLDLKFNEDTQAFKVYYTVKSVEGLATGELDESTLPELTKKIEERRLRNKALTDGGKEPYPITANVLFEDLYDLKDAILTITHERKHTSVENEEKNKIPAEVRKEIEKLLNFSKDPTLNWNATAEVQTCIASRRAKLKEAIKGNEEQLIKIGFPEKEKQRLIFKTADDVIKAKGILTAQLKAREYAGNDKLILSGELLKILNISFDFKSSEDLEALMDLTPEDIRTMGMKEGGNEALAERIVDEVFPLFIHKYSSGKLEAVLDITAPHLIQKAFRGNDSSYVQETLATVQGEKQDVLAKAFYSDPVIGKSLFFELRKNPLKFKAMFTRLSEKQRSMLLFSENKGYRSLFYLLRGHPELIQFILHSLSHEHLLHQALQGDHDFLAIMLNALSPEERLQVINEKREKGTLLHYVANDLRSLQVINNHLDREELLEALYKENAEGKTVIESISKTYCLKNVLDWLGSERCCRLFQKKNDQGNTILHRQCHSTDFMEMARFSLNPDDYLKVITERNIEGDTPLHCAVNQGAFGALRKMVYVLSSDECFQVGNTPNLKGKTVFHYAAKNKETFIEFFMTLSPEKQREAMDVRSHQGKKMLHYGAKNPTAQRNILALLKPEERFQALTERCEKGKTVFHYAAEDSLSLDKMFKAISPAERLQALKERDQAGKTVLEYVLVNPYALRVALIGLTPTDRFAVMTEADENGKTLFDKLDDIPEGLNTFINAYLEEGWEGSPFLHSVIKNPVVFKKILAILRPYKLMDMLEEQDENGNSLLHAVAEDPALLELILSIVATDNRCLSLLLQRDRNGNRLLHRVAPNPYALEIVLNAYPSENRGSALSERDENGEMILFSLVKNNPQSLQVIFKTYSEEELMQEHTIKFIKSYLPYESNKVFYEHLYKNRLNEVIDKIRTIPAWSTHGSNGVFQPASQMNVRERQPEQRDQSNEQICKFGCNNF